MKLKETKNGNYKVTFTPFEMETLMAVVNHCRLGISERADVFYDLSMRLFDTGTFNQETEVLVTFDRSDSEGDTINVYD